MIGVDQEPSRKVLDALNAVLGDGTYAFEYQQDPYGVRGIVRTRETPPREFVARFAPGLEPALVEVAWLELVDRIGKTLTSEREHEARRATDPAPGGVPPPASEISAGGMDLSGPAAPDDQPAFESTSSEVEKPEAPERH